MCVGEGGKGLVCERGERVGRREAADGQDVFCNYTERGTRRAWLLHKYWMVIFEVAFSMVCTAFDEQVRQATLARLAVLL